MGRAGLTPVTPTRLIAETTEMVASCYSWRSSTRPRLHHEHVRNLTNGECLRALFVIGSHIILHKASSLL